MNYDSYCEIINGEYTFNKIAATLLKEGKCIIGWTDQGYDHRDILFTYRPKNLGGCLQRGLIWCELFISIIGCNSAGFVLEDSTDNTMHDSYIKEKLVLRDNSCDDKICELINGVIRHLDVLKEGGFYE